MKHNRYITLLISMLSIMLFCAPNAWYVTPEGSDYADGESWETSLKTVGRAIELATAGDWIGVKAGTYHENNLILPSHYNLVGGFEGTEEKFVEHDPEKYITIIQAEQKGRVVLNRGNLDGFHITGGLSQENEGLEDGGGVLNLGVIQNCKIYQNKSSKHGGGVYNHGSIVKSSIYDNTSRIGGGVYNFGHISQCRIYHNTAEISGGVHNKGRVENGLIYANQAFQNGGGLNSGTITSSTIYRNRASRRTSGIENHGSLINSIIWSNYEQDVFNKGKVMHCCLAMPRKYKWKNIAENPKFVLTEGPVEEWDFHLNPASPCIGSGYQGPAGDIPSVDIEGSKRTNYPTNMGAYLFTGTPEKKVYSPKRIYVHPHGNNTDGQSWESAYNHLEDALPSYSEEMLELFVAQNQYLLNKPLIIPSYARIYAGFYGNESTLEEQDRHAFPTIIDAQKKATAIINYGFIDGFTIVRGKGNHLSEGGGVWNQGILANSIIADNYADYGGGIYNEGYVEYCTVKNNEAIKGGGIFNYNQVTRSEIYTNSADSGGGIWNEQKLIHSTIFHNQAKYQASGIMNLGKVINSISWKNESSDITGGLISSCCFRESKGKNNNISADPLFINTSGSEDEWNFELQPSSPCINAGEDLTKKKKKPQKKKEIEKDKEKIEINEKAKPETIKPDMGAIPFLRETKE